MKIVRGYKVAGQLLVQGHTDLVAKIGDVVDLYLDQVADPDLPEKIRAVIEHPIVTLKCGTKTSYSFSYDESLLTGAITRLRDEDIVDVVVFSTVGRSSYESYLITTDDDPPMTEEEWSNHRFPAYTLSATAPDNTTIPWFDPETGVMSAWNGNAWVVVSTTQGAPGSATNIVTTTADPVSGSTIMGVPDLDETHYVTKSTFGSLAALTWELPAADDARVGQMKVLYCNCAVTALTVSVSGGGTLAGSSLTAGVASEAYSYQCVSVSGAGTWIRIS